MAGCRLRPMDEERVQYQHPSHLLVVLAAEQPSLARGTAVCVWVHSVHHCLISCSLRLCTPFRHAKQVRTLPGVNNARCCCIPSLLIRQDCAVPIPTLCIILSSFRIVTSLQRAEHAVQVALRIPLHGRLSQLQCGRNHPTHQVLASPSLEASGP